MEQNQPKHLSPWIAWSVVVLFFGIGLFCTWYYYFQVGVAYDNAFTNSIGIKKSGTTTATTSKNISTSTIADWQKYTSPSYGYSVEFPKTWTWNGEDPKIVTMDSPEKAALIKAATNDTERPPHDISVYYYASVADEGENVSNKFGATTLSDLMTKSTDLTAVKDTTLGGVSAKEAVRGGMVSQYSVFAVSNGHLYEIVFGSKENKADLSAVESQILSTFKFTK